MFNRSLNLTQVLKRKSVFLFGPRQTGKSTLLRHQFKELQSINLLNEKTYSEYVTRPGLFFERLATLQNSSIIIDEIQRIPSLLNEVHLLIEENHLRFILTGSSARKLKRAGINLLGGRASQYQLHPITFKEFITDAKNRDPLDSLVRYGGLPFILNSPDPFEDMKGYIESYLTQEIKEEAKVRSLTTFTRFLEIAALQTGEQINLTSLASDAEVSRPTLTEYFQILEDTFVGKQVIPFQTPIRKSVAAPKFYLFDVGVANFLAGRFGTAMGSIDYGKALEHLVWRELESYISYNRIDMTVSYWRTYSQIEIDFIVARDSKTPEIAIEVKAKEVLSKRDTKGLMLFSEEFKKVRKIVVTLETSKRIAQDIEYWPARDFLTALWEDQIIVK
jgi:predicted AAA+ superfamily ATPase